MKRRISIIAVAAILIMLTAFTLVQNKKHINAANKVVDRSLLPVAVSVSKVTYQPVENTLQLPAVLDPNKQADISASIPGKIKSLPIQPGSRVSTGQVVGSVDVLQHQLNKKEVVSALAKAGEDYQRNKELYEGNAGTAQSVKEARHAYETAQLQAEQMDYRISEGTIKSPISGIVTIKNYEAGEYINPGVAIATVVDIYTLKAIVLVNEKDVYGLKLNQPATVTTDVFPDKNFKGKVTFISPVGDENHNYRVELVVANSAAELKAGTYCKVTFDTQKKAAVLQVPKMALAEGTKNPYVYVVNNDKVAVRKITTGRELGENIEVLNGLKEGDEVVVSGQINLTDGSTISKINTNK